MMLSKILNSLPTHASVTSSTTTVSPMPSVPGLDPSLIQKAIQKDPPCQCAVHR